MATKGAMLRRTNVLSGPFDCTTPLLKRRQIKTAPSQYAAHGGISGGPGRRRLWAGVTKTIPKLAYSIQQKPIGPPVVKKGIVCTAPDRDLAEPQKYSELEWENHDDWPQTIHPNSEDLQGYGKEGGDYWDGYHFSCSEFRGEVEQRPVQIFKFSAHDLGKVRYPPVPDVDARMLTNAEWNSRDRQERVRQYLQKHHVFSIFPSCSSDINMNVNYAENDSLRGYWQSVYTGNIMEVPKVMKQPRVILPNDGLEDDALYTLVMFTPDHPFRADPEPGHCLHWAVANLKAEGGRIDAAQNADTVLPYLMPLPSEDAGLLRYVFALYKQDKKVDVSPVSAEDAKLEYRKRFFLHSQVVRHPVDEAMQGVNAAIGSDPCAVTFFHCAFDYEVMDWYKANNIEEPMWTPPDIVRDTVNFKRVERSDDYAWRNPYGGVVEMRAGAKWDRSTVDFF